jgi:hypothetical protein
MRKFLVLTTVLVFTGASFAQQIQLDGSREQNPAGSLKHQHRMEWCKQNWEKCKQIKLSYDALAQFKERQEMREMKQKRVLFLEKSESYEAFKSCTARLPHPNLGLKNKEWGSRR